MSPRAAVLGADNGEESQKPVKSHSYIKNQNNVKSWTLASVYGRPQSSRANKAPHLPFVDPVMLAITKPWHTWHTWHAW